MPLTPLPIYNLKNAVAEYRQQSLLGGGIIPFSIFVVSMPDTTLISNPGKGDLHVFSTH